MMIRSAARPSQRSPSLTSPAAAGTLTAPGAGVQRKLAVSSPADPLEVEADRVAQGIMRAPGGAPPPLLRRAGKRSPEDEGVKGKSREAQGMARVELGPGGGADRQAGVGPGQAEDALRALGPGQPLPASERAFFESRFGHDFGRVRVHDGPRAAGVARALNARAFTRSRDVVFDAGEYAPGTWSGRHLLAHELAHVVQQEQGTPGAPDAGTSGPGPGPVGGTIQRDLATPEPAVAPGAQPDLTDEQIRQAIAFNRQRFGFNPASTRLIQDLVGTEPTGIWAEDDVRAIAA
ncbi:MAG TPA: DUF4157 domain-containing protein, partial [Chloroflexota bacterium]|nr:DUF4157 domain-containing protein [Chloroflexota bacterium]